MKVIDMVKDNKTVSFVRFTQQEFWFKTECGFEFPVPVADSKEASFYATDKAMYYMRWIKAHIASIEQGKTEQVAN